MDIKTIKKISRYSAENYFLKVFFTLNERQKKEIKNILCGRDYKNKTTKKCL
jgi:hypothetical protein